MHGTLQHLFDTSRPPRLTQRTAHRLMGHIALTLLVFTIAAFALKVVVHPERAARYTPLVIAHALSMLAWMGLLAAQAYLAAAQNMRIHTKLGVVSLSLVAFMSVTGMIVAINIGQELGRPEVTVVNIAAFVTFLPLYAAALGFAKRREIHAHRLAMLIGTLAFMTPVYARVTDVLGLPPQVAIGVQPPLTIAIALGYDWWVLGRISKAALGMLAFSIAVVMVMVGVLLVWFV
ncbi:MAG: hypothetical protein AAFR88_03540 [Pseudomonadota bacterium]